MRERFIFIFAALLILIPAIVYAECTDGTGLTSHMIAGRVIAPIGTPIEAITKSGECAGHAVYTGDPIAITLWGDYPLTSGGFTHRGITEQNERLKPITPLWQTPSRTPATSWPRSRPSSAAPSAPC